MNRLNKMFIEILSIIGKNLEGEIVTLTDYMGHTNKYKVLGFDYDIDAWQDDGVEGNFTQIHSMLLIDIDENGEEGDEEARYTLEEIMENNQELFLIDLDNLEY